MIKKQGMDERGLEILMNEAKMLAKIDHPNVVKLKRVSMDIDFVVSQFV